MAKRSRTARGRNGPPLLRRQLAVGAGGLALLVATGLSRAQSLPKLMLTRPAARPTIDQSQFISRVGPLARRFRATIGLPPSLVTAMAINETGWGSSELSLRANNYFGIKADVGPGTAGYVVYDTREVINGRVVLVRAPFRAYRSLEECMQDLAAFLHENPRYDTLWAHAAEPRASAVSLSQAGYATDPDWADKLIGLIDDFGLESLDGPTWLPDWLLDSRAPG